MDRNRRKAESGAVVTAPDSATVNQEIATLTDQIAQNRGFFGGADGVNERSRRKAGNPAPRSVLEG